MKNFVHTWYTFVSGFSWDFEPVYLAYHKAKTQKAIVVYWCWSYIKKFSDFTGRFFIILPAANCCDAIPYYFSSCLKYALHFFCCLLFCLYAYGLQLFLTVYFILFIFVKWTVVLRTLVTRFARSYLLIASVARWLPIARCCLLQRFFLSDSNCILLNN